MPGANSTAGHYGEECRLVLLGEGLVRCKEGDKEGAGLEGMGSRRAGTALARLGVARHGGSDVDKCRSGVTICCCQLCASAAQRHFRVSGVAA